ncbi:hypothetical protein NC651_023384 [Populus alba x Populus x berolinensis]|nr:hypothetical protein NC651_023384 [Populus alba x Populus x berolinensis]
MVLGLCIMWYESVSIWSSFGSVVILLSGYCRSFRNWRTGGFLYRK